MDFLNGPVRPVVTYWFFGLYAAVKTAGLVQAYRATDFAAALAGAWLPEDSATLSGILSFWFLGRVLDKRGGQ